jgi:hypothetical protein
MYTIAHVQGLQRIVHLPNPRCRPAAGIPSADLEDGSGSMVQSARGVVPVTLRTGYLAAFPFDTIRPSDPRLCGRSPLAKS